MNHSGKPLVYTAQSKQFFYCRDAVCEFVFKEGGVPLNPFRIYGYFLNDRVPRETIREANRRLLATCDELWVFGEVLADGVVVEVTQAIQERIPVRYFTIDASVSGIVPVTPRRLDFETDVLDVTGLLRGEILDHLLGGSAEQIVHAMGRARELRGANG